jgi:hypothetical protein
MELNSDRKRLDCQRSQAAQFFAKNYSREKRHLVILSRDLAKEFGAINSLGIERAKDFQLFYDFLCDFEKLKELMKEFRWSSEFLKENGIDFKSYRRLYFSAA